MVDSRYVDESLDNMLWAIARHMAKNRPPLFYPFGLVQAFFIVGWACLLVRLLPG